MPVTLVLTPYQARLVYSLLSNARVNDEYEALTLGLIKEKLRRQEKRWLTIEEYVNAHGQSES